jgi:ribosomal peptide maturation radical SAM protein 1
LLYPPFGALAFPSIGLSLLKANLEAAGIPCDVRYLNYDFLDLLPGDDLERLQLFDRYTRRNDYSVGDWIFNGELFGAERARELDRRFARFMTGQGESSDYVETCLEVKSLAGPFLDRVVAETPWQRYAIVGLHSIFNQTVAGLALARRIKELHPRLPILLGGPAAMGETATAILRRFDQIDYVVQGEADDTIVPLVEGLCAGRDVTSVRGLVYRKPLSPDRGPEDGAFEVCENPIDLVSDLDRLPMPDYGDFFARFAGRGYEAGVDVFLPIESSRGCWWGAKQHCTFCGLNSKSMAFRSKSPETVLAELASQSSRHGVRDFACIDSILDMSYYRTLLPMLRDSGLDLRIFYEIKANVRREQVYLLADAGISLVQPGLEHLSTEVLQLMGKGTDYLQNVALLKWARERDLTVFWSILYGFPGEGLDSYREVAERIPALFHLFPPKAPVEVRIDRFSPLHARPEEFGLVNVRPAEAYRHVYPLEGEELARLAYHFEADHRDRDPGLTGRIAALLEPRVREWNRRFFEGEARLDMAAGSQELLIRDTRREGPPRLFLLAGLARRLYLACDAARSLESLVRLAEEPPEGAEAALRALVEGVPYDVAIEVSLRSAAARGHSIERAPGGDAAAGVPAIVGWLLDSGLVATERERYLALACRCLDPTRFVGGGEGVTANLRSLAATRNLSVVTA